MLDTILSTTDTHQTRLSLDPLETSLHPATTPISSGATVQVDRLDWPGDPTPTLSSIFRHSGWATVRVRVYASLCRTVQPINRILAFASCGSNIRVLESNDEPGRYRLAGTYCHDRFCTPCANARGRTIASNILDLAGSQRLRFLTLTLRACVTPLEPRIAEIRGYFSRLKRTSLWKRSVTAGIACLEVKRYKNAEGWHVHYHVLFQGRYIVRSELSRVWKTITGDSDIVDVRLARSRRNVAKYVVKYVTKPLDMTATHDDEYLDEAVLALKGVRLVDTFGAWRGKPITKVDDTGTWHDLGTLDHVIIAARLREPWAAAILLKITSPALRAAVEAAREWTPPTYPHPPPPEKNTPCLFGDFNEFSHPYGQCNY